MEDLIGREEPDDFGLPSTRHQSCLSALLWLAEEGYLRFDSTIRHEALDQAVLSEKGFLRLSRTVATAQPADPALPASVRRVRATLAWQLREALKEDDSERLARLGHLVFDNSAVRPGDIV